MSSRWISAGCVIASLLAWRLFVPPVVAQEVDPAAAQAEFQKTEAEWRSAMQAIAAVKLRYETAQDAEKEALVQQFQTLAAQSRVLEPKLIDAAERYYPSAGNRQTELAQLLGHALRQRVAHDDYEPAYRLAKELLQSGASIADLELLAGLSAFGANEFADADKFLTAATTKGQIEKLSQQKNATAQQLLQNVAAAISTVGDYQGWWETEKKIREAEAKADDLPRVRMTTSKGDLVIELFENEAPIATANFISLVEKGYYDGLAFHRVIGGFMAQGGCPEGTGRGGPGYHIPCECYQENFRRHFRGSLSMAHAGRDTGGSQFFLTFLATPHLNGKHTVFGRVIEGFPVLAQLRRTENAEAGPPDAIQKATVERKRNHPYEPKRLP